MTRSLSWGIAVAALSLATSAVAQDDTPNAEGERAVTRIQLDNGEWLDVEASELIEVYAERKTKPVNRDTELRLTGKELLARGVTTLAEALDEIPQLQVRQAGRGGIQVNIRGGRKGAVKVLIDGAPVDEVFYGTFDLSSIPVTDIAQIRVSMAPSSPIDGVGGPAGVIEIHTIDAVGPRLIRLRAQGSSLPQADLSATGRTEISRGIGIRGSLSAGLGRRDFDVANDDIGSIAINEDRQQVTGAVRLELRGDRERLVVDMFAQQRGFVVPPGEDGTDRVRVIDGESSTRFSATGDIERGPWRVQGRGYVQTLDRETLQYMDATLDEEASREHVFGTRAGAGVIVNRPLGESAQVLGSATIDNENGELEALSGTNTGTTTGSVTVGELAAGGQIDLGPVELDGALGVAIPFSDAGDAPWPEAKLSAEVHPAQVLGLKLTLGRKGRLPTMRERFRVDIGNPDLEAELASFVEVETTIKPSSAIKLRSAAFIRDTDGLVRFNQSANMLVNVNNLIVRGFETDGDVDVTRYATVGASYNFTDSYSPLFGLDSLDFLPRHRIEGRMATRLARGSARVRVRYQSTQIDQQIKIPARTTVDLSAFADIHDNLQASLRLDNALGARALVRRGGVMSPGRVLMLTLQSRWQ